MDIDVLFASVAVRDLEISREWYGRFFGRPADVVPNEFEVMWKANDSAWVYVIDDSERAGGTVVAMAVPNVEAAVSSLGARGITSGPIRPVGDVALKAIVVDPDGNSLELIQV